MINCNKCPDKGSCCGLIPFTKEFIEKHKDKFQVNEYKKVETSNQVCFLIDDLRCIFLNRKTNKCSIYEDRPGICKAYGTTIVNDYMIACPYFKPNGNPWSDAKKKQIERIHNRQTKELLKKGESPQPSDSNGRFENRATFKKGIILV